MRPERIAAAANRPNLVGVSLLVALASAADAAQVSCPLEKDGVPLADADFLVSHPSMPGLEFPIQGNWSTAGTYDPRTVYLLRCQYADADDTVDIRLAHAHDKCELVRVPATGNWNVVCY